MTHSADPLYIADLSQFTKSLRTALEAQPTPPGQAKMMDLISKAAGYRNSQTRKAATRVAQPTGRLGRALRCFENGQMIRWPKQTVIQGLCLWAMWHHLPPRRDMTEPALNEILNAHHTFGDHALLRRSLVDHKMMDRTRDGRVNRRIEQRPPDDAIALIRTLYR